MSPRVSEAPKAFICACSGLMYSNDADESRAFKLGEHRLFRQPLLDRLGHSRSSITLGNFGLIVVERHQNGRRLDVAVDDSLLVGVLDGLADRQGEQLHPPAGR